MKFREGLLQVYKNRHTDGEVMDPFYLYCLLSDLCSSTYEDKNKVGRFYAIDKRLCVFETLIKRGKKGEEELLNSYMVVSDLVSEESFKKLIECAVWVMSPAAQLPVAREKTVGIEQPVVAPKPVNVNKPVVAPKPVNVNKPVVAPKPVNVNKPVVTPKPVNVNKPVVTPKPTYINKPVVGEKKEIKAAPPPPQKAVAKVVKVQPANVTKKQETRTPLTSSSSYSSGGDVDFCIGVGVLLLLVTILAGVVLLIVSGCGIDITWAVWQWVIGIVGGGWLVFLIGIFIYIIDDAIVEEYYMAGLIAVIAFALINVVFLVIFKGNYATIFGCFSVWNIIGSAILSGVCFDDVEDEWGRGYIIIAIVLLLMMIAGLSFLA